LSRGDFEARWEAQIATVEADILQPSEVREAEGYNPQAAAPMVPDPQVA
jgi:hypothetical protein